PAHGKAWRRSRLVVWKILRRVGRGVAACQAIRRRAALGLGRLARASWSPPRTGDHVDVLYPRENSLPAWANPRLRVCAGLSRLLRAGDRVLRGDGAPAGEERGRARRGAGRAELRAPRAAGLRGV